MCTEWTSQPTLDFVSTPGVHHGCRLRAALPLHFMLRSWLLCVLTSKRNVRVKASRHC